MSNYNAESFTALTGSSAIYSLVPATFKLNSKHRKQENADIVGIKADDVVGSFPYAVRYVTDSNDTKQLHSTKHELLVPAVISELKKLKPLIDLKSSGSININTSLSSTGTMLGYKVKGTTYTAVSRLIFPGTKRITVDEIAFYAYTSTSASPSDFLRIMDITNGTIIGTSSTVVNSGNTTLNNLAFTNLSLNESLWEVQLKSSNSTNFVILDALSILGSATVYSDL